MVDLWVPIVAIVFAVGLPIVVFAVIIYKNQQTKHNERMAMIEKGMILEEPERKVSKYNALRNGLLMIGLAIGAIIGMFIETSLSRWQESFLTLIMTILGGGIAFIVYFFLARKIEQGEKEQNKTDE